MTTFEPGARLVFTHGLLFRPFSTAFFASRPAAIITVGFDVLVQLVIAAITTAPCIELGVLGWRSTAPLPPCRDRAAPSSSARPSSTSG